MLLKELVKYAPKLIAQLAHKLEQMKKYVQNAQQVGEFSLINLLLPPPLLALNVKDVLKTV